MRNLLFLLFFVSVSVFSQNSAQNELVKDPVYMGLNGKFSQMEIVHYSGSGTKSNPLGKVEKVEVYVFDTNGYLTERRAYSNKLKKVLLEKDTYKRDKTGRATEIYKGFNLNDTHYVAESLWRMIKQDGNTELWQLIKDDWWGTSYKSVTHKNGEKVIQNYVIQTKNKQKSNVENIVETYNDRGQLIQEYKEATSQSNPQNTTVWSYDENGCLLKEVLTQKWKNDGTVRETVVSSFTIDKTDDKNNPTQITDDQGKIRVYTYKN